MKLAELGLVGCGGAGFPSHVKCEASGIDHLIINGAECEPLLHKDKEILRHHTAEFLRGVTMAAHLTGAKEAHIGVKATYADVVDRLRKSLAHKSLADVRMNVLPLGDFYPSGDEYELVYEATKRLIPFGGIPLHVGCVVINVETLLNLGRKRPVTTKFLTIAGAVPHPITVELPIGISVREAIALAKCDSLDGLAVIDGGPMMGRLLRDLDNEVITKTCGGLLVLPTDHPLIVRMSRPIERDRRIARSACDQCTDCSELCPRALLGYPIRPHKAMRTAQLAAFNDRSISRDSMFCCECGLCSLFACPEDLPPREMAVDAKRYHLSQGLKPTEWPGKPAIHPMRSARRVTIDRLLKKLALLDFDHKAPLTPVVFRPEKVRLPLKMHVGAPVRPLVAVNETVTLGQKIGAPPTDKLGAVLHASIAGQVTEVTPLAITIARHA